MRSVDKLREKIRLDVNNPWSDLKGDLLSLVDKVEAEIEERYMELPVDADGVPIRVGDKLEYRELTFDAFSVAEDVVFRECGFESGRYTVDVYDHSDVRHHNPRTLEDVLADFAAEVENDRNTIETARKYADEIRELMDKAGD